MAKAPSEAPAAKKQAERSAINERLLKLPFRSRRQQKAMEAKRLFELGWATDDIAYALNVSDGREVRRLKAEAERFSIDGPEPFTLEHLSSSHRAMVQPWLAWWDHARDCRDCWDDSFTGHDSMVDAAVVGYETFFNTFNRENHTLTAHARTWVWQAFRHIRLLLNVPPRHAKSTYLSIWVPIFLVCADRNFQVLIISQTVDFAKKFGRAIATEFTENQALIEAFGRFLPSDSKKTWSPSQGQLKVEGATRGDRSIQVRGARQQVLGMEADWITLDDADDPDIARSDLEERRLRNWYEEQVVTRGVPGCHITAIGQRVGYDDFSHYLAAKTWEQRGETKHVFKHIMQPAVLDWETEEVLWPEVWPFDRLMRERYADNKETFEVMYQQNPSTEGSKIFDPAWITGEGGNIGCLDRDRRAGEGFPEIEGPRVISRVISVDPSPTQYSAFVVADVLHSYTECHINLVAIETEKIHGREILNKIEWLMRVYGPIDYLIIEDSAVSKWIFQDPWYESMKYQVQIRGHNTSAKSKGDPEWGVQSLAADFEFGRIRFPYGDPDGIAMSNILLSEMYGYTTQERNRFDTIMALWFIRYAYRALVPRSQLEGGFRGRVGNRISPAWKRAHNRKKTEDQIVRDYRRGKYGTQTPVNVSV